MTKRILKALAVFTLLCSINVRGQGMLDSMQQKVISEYLKEGALAYQKEDLTTALEYFQAAFEATPPPYNSTLKLNVVKNYLALLGLGKNPELFEDISEIVLGELQFYQCDVQTNSIAVGALVNIIGGASYMEETALAERSYNKLVFLVKHCDLDSIDLAQGALNMASMYLKISRFVEAEKYLSVGQKYRGSHYNIYDAELSFLEARMLFRERKFGKSKSKLIESSDLFFEAGSVERALNPLNFGIRKLTPFLDSVAIAELVRKNFLLSEKLGYSDNSAQLKLVESLVKINTLERELALSVKKKSSTFTIVSLVSILITFALSILLFQRQSNTIKSLSSSLKRYRNNSLNGDDVQSLLEDCLSFGRQLSNGVHGKLEELNGDKVETLFAQFFPYLYNGILVSHAAWTTGERQLFITLVLDLSANNAATALQTTLNSYRVRKSKLIKKLPEEFKQNPKALISQIPRHKGKD